MNSIGSRESLVQTQLVVVGISEVQLAVEEIKRIDVSPKQCLGGNFEGRSNPDLLWPLIVICLPQSATKSVTAAIRAPEKRWSYLRRFGPESRAPGARKSP